MQHLTISFEFFPPKTPQSTQQLMQTAEQLLRFSPEFFSVTYGAGGSTREGTVNTLIQLREQFNVIVAPHLSCIGLSKEYLLEVLNHYKSLGVRRIIALRGDLPSGMGNTGDLQHASDLVSLITKTHGKHFHIEVAAYPDIHPQAQNVKQDILNLKRKVDAGANSAITQYFYNADAYFRLLDECEKNHIHIPIVPGIMPIFQYTKLLRFSENCGADLPRWMRKRFESFGDDTDAIQQFGFEVVYRLCERLVNHGVKHFHFYTLNRAEPSMKILTALQDYVTIKKMTSEEIV